MNIYIIMHTLALSMTWISCFLSSSDKSDILAISLTDFVTPLSTLLLETAFILEELMTIY